MLKLRRYGRRSDKGRTLVQRFMRTNKSIYQLIRQRLDDLIQNTHLTFQHAKNKEKLLINVLTFCDDFLGKKVICITLEVTDTRCVSRKGYIVLLKATTVRGGVCAETYFCFECVRVDYSNRSDEESSLAYYISYN